MTNGARRTAHQQRRIDRAESRAARRYEQGTALVNAARELGSVIPFGQPILVGHHSERRDRNYRARIGRKYDAGFAAIQEARELEASAAGAGRAIMRDDPEAIEALTAKVAALKASQERMKAANKALRLKDPAKSDAALVALNFTPEQIAGLRKADFCGRTGFPSYAITNNGANIRRIEERIATLKRDAVRVAMAPIAGDGWTLAEHPEEARLWITFDAKPDRAMLDALRGAGFKWSPTRNAHVRMMSNGALYNARRVLGITEETSP